MILPGIVVSVSGWYKVIVTGVCSPIVETVVYMKDFIVAEFLFNTVVYMLMDEAM